MKKIFNYALLAAALLVGVNVNAKNVAKIGEKTYSSIEEAFADAQGTAQEPVTITMLDDANFGTCRINLSGKYIVWDLAGKTVGTKAGEKVYSGFVMDGGYFEMVNSSATPATVNLRNGWKWNTATGFWNDHTGYGFQIYGSATDQPDYSTFILDGDIKMNFIEEGYGVKVEAAPNANKKGKQGNGMAYGVTIDIKKGYIFGHYGALFTSGNIQESEGTNRAKIYVGKDAELAAYDGLSTLDDKSKAAVALHFSKKWYGDGNHTNEADVVAEKESYRESSSAIYGAGVATWNLKGYIHGGNGLYIKGGKVSLDGARVSATAAEYHEPITENSGYMACGSAIVLDSNENYGDLDGVTITGDSEISSTSGWGIEEVATAGGTKVPDIVIESGTISGEAGSISTTAEVKEDVVLNGTITGGTFSDTKIQDYLPNVDGVIVPHTDPETGVTTYSVETIPGGIEAARLNNIHGDVADKDVAIADGKNEVIAVGENITCQSLIVEKGATLKIEGKLTVAGLNIAGKVTVAQNGILIVKEKGVVCFNAQDFVIEAKEGAMGKFLLSPAVPGNTHPTATVQFISKAKKLTTWDRFGVPAYEGMTAPQIHCETEGTATYLYTWNNEKNGWDQVKSASQVLLPFQGLTMTNNSTTGGVVYDFPCPLVGNGNASLNMAAGWSSFANSYTAEADIKAYLTSIMANYQEDVEATIHTYINGKEDGSEEWEHTSFATATEGEGGISKLTPMQAFVLRNMKTTKVQGGINYEESIWNPAMGINNGGGNNAPRQMMDMNKVVINLTDAQGNEGRLTIREAAEFSADFDNGYDATLYESASKFNFYAATDYANQFEIATNNIEGQVLTLATKDETSYTMSFSNVRGETMAIRDNMTGEVIEMAEGVTYNFIANANEVSERFTIIAAAKAPTAIQKAKASAKAAKFIRHDQVVLQNNGRMFNVLGIEVK